jgi:hypothetical protein
LSFWTSPATANGGQVLRHLGLGSSRPRFRSSVRYRIATIASPSIAA